MANAPLFQNFDLHIGQGEDGVYPISVYASPAGETAAPLQVSIAHDDEPMRRWLKRLQSGFTARDDLVALGRRLAGYLLPPGQVRDRYQHSLGMAEAEGWNLRLRLRISPPELAALPWEYAYDEDIADFFVLNPRTALVRYHSQPVPPRAVASHTPVPILVLISNPPSASPLAAVKEMRNLVNALGHLLDEARARMDVLFSGQAEERRAIEALVADQQGARLRPGPASIDALRDALRDGPRVIHYVGHGGFLGADERKGVSSHVLPAEEAQVRDARRLQTLAGGALLLVDDEAGATWVGARTLARELRGSSAGVVVLNACKTATESTARSFMGLAPNLIRAGVPAVVAMQYAIPDSSAVYFSHALYKALADGWPLDAAVTEGRKAISARVTEDDMDWGIPVLFMRSSDGVIWKVESDEVGEQVAGPEAASGGITVKAGDIRDSQVAIGNNIQQTKT